MILYIALILVVIALIFLWQSTRQRREAGLPGGRVIYTDTRAWGAVEKPLFHNELGLTGKPDYLVERNGKLIPVEVKTGREPNAPYDSHIFQLAAYCLLVEKTYGKRPPYGIIHYAHRDFAVDYTPQLESALLDQLAEMRRDELRTDVPRSHGDAARCRHCGFRKVCDQSLA
ncbi:MAG TPA: CRISPR-associated protein Cas4 [Anaerolineales bacterium]|nr:CRISPR-associated protein Cas4 [Anaerolineales bacterium]